LTTQQYSEFSRYHLSGYWFSKNPSKAWAEKFFLLYIPYFFALNGAKQAFGWLDVGNLAHITQNLALLIPLFLVPLLIRDETPLGRKWYQTYWFKMNLWIFIFTFIATYFFTEYFFDVLGMVYSFPHVSFYLDSALLGSGALKVPVGMYLNAPAFFVVYHTIAVILMRRIRTIGLPGGIAVTVLVVCAVAYAMAFLETKLIATDANSTAFYYKDLSVMLKYGSIFYALYFVVSFPMVYRLEENTNDNWPLSKVCCEALAAGMMVFFLLDIASHFVL